MSFDHIVRLTLLDHADRYTPPTDLLGGVRRRARELRRRQLVTSAFVAIIAIVLTSVGFLLRPDRDGPDGLVVALVVAPEPPTFPLTPGWEPDWVGMRSFTYVRGTSATMRYEPTYPFGATLTVDITTTDPRLSGAAVQVGARAAVMSSTAADSRIAWRTTTGWVLVTGTAPTSPDELLHFATGLADTPRRMDVPFQLTALPAGADLVHLDRTLMLFTGSGPQGPQLRVALVSAASVPRSTFPTLDGQARAAVVDGGAIVAYRQIDSDRAVRVWAAAEWHLTPAQVAEIARGVAVTSIAITSGG